MAHDTHTDSLRNQDIPHGLKDARGYYLSLAKHWKDPFQTPLVYAHQVADGRTFCVVEENHLLVGSKARFGHLLLSSLPKKGPIVYVAPRFGFAAISLAYLCREVFNRELILFMPACKQISEHQAVAIEMGAKPIFYRIAAMPNLNKVAAEWAAVNGGHFIPLGLKHELVTAAIVRTACELSLHYSMGNEFWTAMSTGVLSRGLQIAWPKKTCYAVAVARNIKDGEKGSAALFSCPREFSQNATIKPPFESASNYDAKVWEFMLDPEEGAEDNAIFWNVAGNISPKRQSTFDIYSDAPWGAYLKP
jgi:hypothetical protein